MRVRSLRGQRVSLTARVLVASVLQVLVLGADSPVWAGTYLLSGEVDGVESVNHPPGFTGAGGALTVSICIDPASPDALVFEDSLQRAIATWNAAVPVTGNVVVTSDVPSNAIDAESVLLHEIGHCIGVGHPELGGVEPDFMGPLPDPYTRSFDGPNDLWDLDDGADDVIGSSDDLRGDDINLSWFEIANNDPFTMGSVVDSTTYSLDLADLPAGDSFASGANRDVAALLGYPDTESAMYYATAAGEAIRELAADEIAVVRYGMSGLDELQGTADDYSLQLQYVGQSASCDIVLETQTVLGNTLASCDFGTIATPLPDPSDPTHFAFLGPRIIMYTTWNWFAPTCGDGTVEGGEECDDGNTADGDCCSSICTAEALGGACDDGFACTAADQCDGAGACVGVPDDAICDNGVFCDGAELCDVASGCQPGPPPADDGVACTDDSCDEGSGVVTNVPNDALCDNGVFCDGMETCDAVLDCQAGAPPAEDGVACTVDVCDEGTQTATNTPDDLACDDGNPCTADSCDAVTGCGNAFIPACTPPVVIQNLEFDVDAVFPSSLPEIVFFDSFGANESARFAVTGGHLVLATFGTSAGNASYLSPNFSVTGGPFDASLMTIMESRVRVTEISGSGSAFFQVFDGSYGYTVAFAPGGVDVSTASGNVFIPVADLDAFHTYRIVSSATGDLSFYVDGTLELQAAAPASTLNGYGFGDGVTAAGNNATAYFDYIRLSQQAPTPPPVPALPYAWPALLWLAVPLAFIGLRMRRGATPSG